ncbi:sigma-70 family RNA polymerase sigma factor [Clostridium beijerinckii]|uniref:sigma-70 family RNA polymerase sigma factor n=1 Tax=Clostridium beijerinckii TaxID=1520 RepID=UPI00098BD466|nr:sigma-70 family RNA polymerase sigma factor [Clostridium beijerinckii]NRT35430.1 RNA polymerase sigma factor (sigma-70 family) [Clostridium beijerinckii]NRT45141.1 RNA polymerase sigma factor (sigma-70 family) [Clostridium beijerinckii]NRU38856.1 RNA polymerase sigma factor (sigma-70 family) [Clostridium beijerinckii]NRZ20862.1 RNA polymerase sigma factor (sigma-70 family) [Clostridium beijerinckii]NSA97865.1 RNA polymerase sigma factor (sigma-70 family) [Clostridium beijerinckii]
MKYEYVENLVSEAKSGSSIAKENLILEFTPFIRFVANKIFISGYDYSDKVNECFATLLTCISKYNLGTNRFAAYAMNSIQKNLNSLIRKSVHATEYNGMSILSLDDDLENYIALDTDPLDETLCLTAEYEDLTSAINTKLTDEEKTLISFLYFKENTLVNYTYYRNVSYMTASKRKKKVLGKLRNYMNSEVMNYGN